MSTHANNVSMTVSGTPGTGTITLGSASSGARSFASAYGANATVDVFITEGTAWEVARNCTYTHSGTTLTRGTLESSSTGAAISLTSAAVVRVAATADWGNRIERALQSVIPGGRLTLESGVPVSTTDQTAKTTIYYTPFVHNTIPLWDGSDWRPTTFTETSLAIGTLTSARPYDVFGYLSSGSLVLESLAWTNDTTRATAVTLQDGRYCKSGDKTRLYLGTFYTTATTTTEDSEARRYVWNNYNRTIRRLRCIDETSHAYTTATQRQWRNVATDGVTQFSFLSPINAEPVIVGFSTQLFGSGIVGYVTYGMNSTTVNETVYLMGNSLVNFRSAGAGVSLSRVGQNTVSACEYGASGVTYEQIRVGSTVTC